MENELNGNKWMRGSQMGMRKRNVTRMELCEMTNNTKTGNSGKGSRGVG